MNKFEDEESAIEKILDLRDKRTLTEIGIEFLQGYNELRALGSSLDLSKNEMLTHLGTDALQGYNEDITLGKTFDSKDKNIFSDIGENCSSGRSKNMLEQLGEDTLNIKDKIVISTVGEKLVEGYNDDKVLGDVIDLKNRSFYAEIGEKLSKSYDKDNPFGDSFNMKEKNLFSGIGVDLTVEDEKEDNKASGENKLNVNDKKLNISHEGSRDYTSKSRDHKQKFSDVMKNAKKNPDYFRRIIKEYYESTDEDKSSSTDTENTQRVHIKFKNKKGVFDLKKEKKRSNLFKFMYKRIKKKNKCRYILSKVVATFAIIILSPVILLISLYVGIYVSFSKYLGEYIFIYKGKI
ncbi:hypothetical protein PMALA_045860 [Plasmodium malariae]|nr:hypothetical protein PMALA_045860 [Plasmodium malariae]